MSTDRVDAIGRLMVVEASAGTGKTHQITRRVVDHVTRLGVPIERILVVTFTRAATAELRDRIRRALADAAREGDGETARRAADAVTSFDLATVTTIHGFCHQVLGNLGLIDDASSSSITTDDRDLRSEVLNDALLRQVAGSDATSPLVELFAPEAGDPPMREDKVRPILRLMLTHPTADVITRPAAPTPKAPGLDPALHDGWRSFLLQVRDDVLARRSAAGVMTHDDVLRLARDAVVSDPIRALAVAERFDLVLIDEFQDTDALQWDLFVATFLAPRAADEPAGPRMYVVGDPKQAIYAFRGADVHAYLQARALADCTDTLEESWRMEPPLLEATNLLFRGATFGEPSIEHADLRPPQERSQNGGPTLVGDPLPAPFVVRAIEPTVPDSAPAKAYVKADDALPLVARDVAAVIEELLASGAQIEQPDQDECALARPLAPRDVAVLVGRHREADVVAQALDARGIRSVRRSTASVMTSPAAEQWRWLLTAMDRPFSPSAASMAAMSWFVGWSPDELAEPEADDRLAGVQDLLAEWRRTLADGGIAGLLAVLRATSGLTERVLAGADGERNITDLEHVAELLHDAVPGPTTPATLSDVLLEHVGEDEEAEEHAARRIDSDDDAVQILTIHAAKGLQFAVTLVPFLWLSRARKDERIVHHEGKLALDVTIGARDPGLQQLATTEARGTLQRLAYVALTRARHRTVVWWGNAHNAPANPLTTLLTERTPDAAQVCTDGSATKVKGDFSLAWDRLTVLAGQSGGTIDVARAAPPDPPARPPSPTGAELAVNTFNRRFDRRWRRHSFSAIAAPARHVHVEQLVPADDELVAEDGPAEATVEEGALGPPFDESVRAPLLELTIAGTDFGTAFHTLMEHLDFAAPDLAAEIDRVVDERWPWATIPVPRGVLVEGLAGVLSAPTGRWLGDRPLRHLTRADRLDELVFELPLATSGRAVTARDIGILMADHLAEGDPFVAYAQHLHDDAFAVDLAGHLTGSIDLVARFHDADGSPRFTVCDYKTNRLSPTLVGRALDAYHPARLPLEMTRHHYPLQALLYGVALHRYLRWRLRGYEPRRHLAGAAYLFVRGMVGSATPTVDGDPVGVCGWDVPPDLTVALSDLLDGRRP